LGQGQPNWTRRFQVPLPKSLPGLYWLTFFGAPYRELITSARLMSAPECQVTAHGSGYTLKLSDSPDDWSFSAYRDKEELIRRHLGEQYFFIRERVQKETVSPFNLPLLPDPKLTISAEVDRDGTINNIRIRER
jgi:hypothetical protein